MCPTLRFVWHALWFRLLLGISVPAGPAKEPPSLPLTPELRDALSGTWIYAGGGPEQAKVNAAVERAVAALPALSRNITLDALRQRANPRPSYVLAFDGTLVRISSPEEPDEGGEVGGPWVPLTDRFGDRRVTTFRVEGRSLVEAGWSSDGSGQTAFTPARDGKTLQVHRVMQRNRLADAVNVTLTYRRQV